MGRWVHGVHLSAGALEDGERLIRLTLAGGEVEMRPSQALSLVRALVARLPEELRRELRDDLGVPA